MGELYTFTVNGQSVSTQEDKPLLRYLRDDLKLYSVKDGCSEGACGACTIIVDGKPVRSCVQKTSKAVGKTILTVEGLSIEEKEAFVYAFGACGAVQCGFCIPGMVMSGKALLDVNPDPTDEEIKAAIKGNVCRCTGYVKIIEAIRLVGAILRGEKEIDPSLEEMGLPVGDAYIQWQKWVVHLFLLHHYTPCFQIRNSSFTAGFSVQSRGNRSPCSFTYSR